MENVKKDEVSEFLNEERYQNSINFSHLPKLPNYVYSLPPSPKSSHSVELEFPEDYSSHIEEPMSSIRSTPSPAVKHNPVPIRGYAPPYCNNTYLPFCPPPLGFQCQYPFAPQQFPHNIAMKVNKGRKRKRSITNPIELEKKRLLKNKISARESRKKKKFYVQKLEDQVLQK